MKLRTPSAAGRRPRWLSRPDASCGGSAVACASAAPLVVLALAVAADCAHVSRFKTQVQLAADAASLAAAIAIAHDSGGAGEGLAAAAAAAAFARNAPPGAAGTPRVAAANRGAAATAQVGYDGVAPSNFGSTLGYGAFSVSASANPLALLADSQASAAP